MTTNNNIADATVEPLITGLHHINLTIPHGTLGHAASFYGTTLGLTPRPVPAAQTHELAWFDIGASGQQVHISLPKHDNDTTDASLSRHPCFKVGSPEALLKLQERVHAHFTRGGGDAPVAADAPGVSSGAKGPEYPKRFFARDFAGNRLEFTVKQVEANITYCRKDLVPPLPPVVFGRGPANPPIQTPKQDYPVLITDVTGHEDEFNLQTQGIEFVRHESKLQDEAFDDENLVKQEYYDEILDLTKQVLEQNPKFPKNPSLYILQHLRRNSPDKFPTGPVHGVHVDQHPAAVADFARRWLGQATADELIATHKRWQIINIWRPIAPVQRDPFAVADARSVPDDDILRVKLVYPDHEIDILEVKAPLEPGAHKWYFKDGMGPGDVVFFTQFDSTGRGDVPKRVPHTAFRDLRADEGVAEARRSIEVRVAVFYDDD